METKIRVGSVVFKMEMGQAVKRVKVLKNTTGEGGILVMDVATIKNIHKVRDLTEKDVEKHAYSVSITELSY